MGSTGRTKTEADASADAAKQADCPKDNPVDCGSNCCPLQYPICGGCGFDCCAEEVSGAGGTDASGSAAGSGVSGSGSGGSGSISCGSSTLKLSDFTECKTFFDSLAKCCPKIYTDQSIYDSSVKTTICQTGLSKDQINSACRAASNQISSICSSISSMASCK